MVLEPHLAGGHVFEPYFPTLLIKSKGGCLWFVYRGSVCPYVPFHVRKWGCT